MATAGLSATLQTRMKLAFVALLLASGAALADDPDTAALLLADQVPDKSAQARDWQLFVEGAFGHSSVRSGSQIENQRLSFDIFLDKALTRDWRAVFADRLDLNWSNQPNRQNGVNTLKEAFVSWQPREDYVFDLGRINARYGVATGYNPTDYFRAGANRSIVSADPASLKKNRLGSVMLRGQTLWEGGSLSALYSPNLKAQPNRASLNPDVGATNNQHRWLLAVSHKIADNINPQWLLYDEESHAPQLGFNMAVLANDATVAYVEWSGGRSRSLLTDALNRTNDTSFRNRAAGGLTYTTAYKLSLTLEYQYNGAGLSEAEWKALPRISPAAYGQYRRVVHELQELPTRQAVFFYGYWQDALLNHFDLNAMLRFNLADRSHLSWVEARYRWEHAEAALQWQMNIGNPASEFGAMTQRRIVQAVVRYFF